MPSKSTFKITFKQLALIIVFILFQFLCYFSENDSVLKYTDELLTILAAGTCFVKVIRRGRIKRLSSQIWILICLVIITGLIGNSKSEVDRSTIIILYDVLGCTKMFIMFAATLNTKISQKDWSVVITSVAKIVRITVIIAFVLMLFNFIGDFGMRDDFRYGIHGFRFIFINAGTLSTVCYGYIIVLTLVIPDLKSQRQMRFNYLCIVLTLIVWLSTLRTRAFVFTLFYCLVLYYFVLRRNKTDDKKSKNRIRIWQVIISLAGILTLSANTFEKYFTNTRMARYQLLHGSIELFIKFFPIGAGFGTYGTNIAKEYYSPLYHNLGFGFIWGMSESMRDLLTDSCWPAILGQFGLIGVILYIVLLYKVLTYIYRFSRNNKYYFVVGLFFIVITVGSSVATSTFFHYETVGQILMLTFLCEKERLSVGRQDL